MPRRLLLLSAAVLTVFGQTAAPTMANPPQKGPTRTDSYRPLADAADLLRHLYGKVVTYEETVLT